MRVVNEILTVLEDGEWHGYKEFLTRFFSRLNIGFVFKLFVAFKFLAEYGFIEVDEKGLKARLAPRYQTFLKEIKELERADVRA